MNKLHQLLRINPNNKVNNLKLALAGLMILSSAVHAEVLSEQQTILYLETTCTDAAYPNDKVAAQNWKIKQVVDGTDVVGYIVEDEKTRCLIAVDKQGHLTGMQISRSKPES
jgi:hypothetical protein